MNRPQNQMVAVFCVECITPLWLHGVEMNGTNYNITMDYHETYKQPIPAKHYLCIVVPHDV